MASISTDHNGNRRILFMLGKNNRKVVRLGKVPMKTAEEIKRRIVLLATAVETGVSADHETAQWVGRRDAAFYDKLAAVGLVPGRAKPEQKLLGPFVDEFIAKRQGKPSSKEVWRIGMLRLVEFFGANRPLAEITAGMADDYVNFLKGSTVSYSKTKALSSMTVRNRLLFAKMIFRAACRHKLVEVDPFADVATTATMPDRHRFITREETAKLLDACPNQDWRIIIALARWGGQRCPSEVLSLRWEDIDWQAGRVTVHSPKTEHHAGGEKRVMPLFPKLRAELEPAWTPESNGYVINERLRQVCLGKHGWNNGLRFPMANIVKRAGLETWQRQFHNLRSTRQTELEEQFPSHVVCAWLGNTRSIATKHYLQVTDEHFAKAAHNQAQNTAVRVCKGEQSKPATNVIADEKAPLHIYTHVQDDVIHRKHTACANDSLYLLGFRCHCRHCVGLFSFVTALTPACWVSHEI